MQGAAEKILWKTLFSRIFNDEMTDELEGSSRGVDGKERERRLILVWNGDLTLKIGREVELKRRGGPLSSFTSSVSVGWSVGVEGREIDSVDIRGVETEEQERK